MHSIERYGIVALLFLVVTVVAVLMWDGGKAKKKENVAGAHALRAAAQDTAAPLARGPDQSGAGELDAERRLSLVAESAPGPLLRQPKARRAVAFGTESELQPMAGELVPEVESSAPGSLEGALEGAPEVHTPAEAPARTGTRREEPARDPIVGRAPASATHAYSVRSGDTLSEIAQRELGSARRWPEIVAANPGLDPARLRAGKTIQIPGAEPASGTAKAEPRTARAADKAAKTWKVAQGENLWKIAERALGDGKRWGEIAALNPRTNPDRLVLGQVLALPSSGSAPAKPARSTAQAENKKSTLVASTNAGRPATRGGKVR